MTSGICTAVFVLLFFSPCFTLTLSVIAVEDNQRIKAAAEKVVAQMTGMKEITRKADFYESQKAEFEKERKVSSLPFFFVLFCFFV